MKRVDFELIKESGIAKLISDNTLDKPLIVSGIPDEWKKQFYSHGFIDYAQYNDYWIENLTLAGDKYNNYEYLKLEDCAAASQITILCRGKSRGFEGETPDWFASWLRGEETGQIDCGCQNNAVLIHKINSSIIGICCTAIYAHDSEKGAVVWVRELAVHPDFQGNGIGQNLLNQTLQYGYEHGAKRAFLHADTLNFAAIHIYAKAGFQPRDGQGQLDMIWGEI